MDCERAVKLVNLKLTIFKTLFGFKWDDVQSALGLWGYYLKGNDKGFGIVSRLSQWHRITIEADQFQLNARIFFFFTRKKNFLLIT